jgi:hypothetical protein
MSSTAFGASLPAQESHSFYVRMGVVYLLIAFGGFAPTYWAPVAAGTFHAPPAIHVHGLLMFTWVCFYVVQTALVASGRTMRHRDWGLAGIALFSTIACAILVGVMATIKAATAAGFGDAALHFSAVTLVGWPVMVTFFALAIANHRDAAVHKRLMNLLMIAMMVPAIARVFLTVLAPPGAASGGPPPLFVTIPPSIVADLLLVVAMVRDWRTLGRVHPVYIWGGLALVAQQMLTVPFGATDTWMSIARAFVRLAG